MKFHYTNLETCSEASGMVIVIDVIRAFTNAAFILAGGAKEIYPVASIEEALEYKRQNKVTLVCGEIGGLPPEGFDFGNSPTQVLKMNLQGRVIMQRTGTGTQGVARSMKAEKIVAASFVVADATARYVRQLAPQEVTFVVTGQTYDGGDEDVVCAEYLESLLKDQLPDPTPFLERVRKSHDAEIFFNPDNPQFPESDITHCTSLNKFDFAMPVFKENGRQVMRAISP